MIKRLSTTDRIDGQELAGLADVIKDWEARIGPLASKKYVANLIDRFATMLSCDIPDSTGLEMYFAVLCEYPETLLRQAAKEVVKTHKWPRLPVPADFIEKIEDEAMRAYWLLQNARTTLRILHKRMK